MWLLKRNRVEIIGYYDTIAEAMIALDEERQKEDGVELNIESEIRDDAAK